MSTQTAPQSAVAMRCIICSGQSWTIAQAGVVDYLTDETFDIDRCATCGLMVTRPVPSESEMGRYYPPRYRGNRHGFTGKMRVALRRRAIESQFDKNFRGRLLDVGCGNGAFALEMKNRGWIVSATEIDSQTVDRLRGQGIDAKTPAEAERDGFSEPFDAATCWHVLEHVHHPAEVATWVRTQLKPSGIFQATVPNAGCLQAKIFGKNWLHLDVPRHLYHFTPDTLHRLLKNCGFSVTSQTCFAIEYDWFGIIQSALNPICSRPNQLFEKLSGAPGAKPATITDGIISFGVGPIVAGASLLPMLGLWGYGDGATLTMICKP